MRTGVDHLHGLPGVQAVAAHSSMGASSLTSGTLQTVVEKALKQGGVPILTRKDAPWLRVEVTTWREARDYVIRIRLQEPVRLERDGRIRVADASVWEWSSTGEGGTAHDVLLAVQEGIMKFATKYRLANPSIRRKSATPAANGTGGRN